MCCRYNKSLVQDESASFVLSLASQEPDARLTICGLKSGGLLLEKTVTRCAIDADKHPTRVRGLSNVLVYKEVMKVLSYEIVEHFIFCSFYFLREVHQGFVLVFHHLEII